MPAVATFTSYPEFLIVGLLSVLLLVINSAKREFHAPVFIWSPSLTVLETLPVAYQQWIIKRLQWSGHRTLSALRDFASLKLAALLLSIFTAFFTPLYATILIALIAYFLPDGALYYQSVRRQKQIRDSLPQAIDLMVMCVDAGLALDATFQRIAGDHSKLDSALNQEFTHLGQDLLLGKDRSRAYMELYQRTGVPELRTFASALNQSTKMGLSVAKLLRAQSDYIRGRQRQKCEEGAAKLPIWMAFPLWFCIMPALLLVIVGPSLIGLLRPFAARFPAGLF